MLGTRAGQSQRLPGELKLTPLASQPPLIADPPANRLALIDAIKGLAAQLIVLHHLAFYGPMSDAALELAPGLIAWLYDYARMAVQAFLVVGGFLAARWLAPEGVLLTRKPLRLLGRRYLALVRPFIVALLLAIAAAAFARSLITHEAIPEAPGVMQFVAHALLIHGVTGIESLSAGVWYIAIDFQLFFLLLLLLTISRNRVGNWLLIAALTIASLFYFNRQAELDNWGIYFFGAYGLGAFAHWSSRHRQAWLWVALLLVTAIAALMLEFRPRLAVAVAVASLLAVSAHTHLLSWPRSRILGWLGKISYSVFLMHFPVILVVAAVVHRLAPGEPLPNLFGMLLSWCLSLFVAAAFYHFVERPLRHR